MEVELNVFILNNSNQLRQQILRNVKHLSPCIFCEECIMNLLSFQNPVRMLALHTGQTDLGLIWKDGFIRSVDLAVLISLKYLLLTYLCPFDVLLVPSLQC